MASQIRYRIVIKRAKLAQLLLESLIAHPGRPLYLIDSTQVGKTLFLKNDCTSAAVEAGMVPLYVDLNYNPLETICQALVTASSEHLCSPNGLPVDLALRLDQLVFQWARTSQVKILLMLDNAQSLHAEGSSLASTLRALLTRHAHHLTALFAGSSKLALAEATAMPQAPLYQFVKVVDFPALEQGLEP